MQKINHYMNNDVGMSITQAYLAYEFIVLSSNDLALTCVSSLDSLELSCEFLVGESELLYSDIVASGEYMIGMAFYEYLPMEILLDVVRSLWLLLGHDR